MKKIFAATLLAMTTLTAAHARADDWANAPAVTKLIAQANKTVVHSKTSARPAAAMPAVQTEVLPEPRIVDASGKDLAQDQNADDTVCARDGVKYKSSVVDQRSAVDASGRTILFAMCAPKGESVYNGFMYVLLEKAGGAGQDPAAAEGALRDYCKTNQDGGAVTGQVLTYTAGSKKPGFYAVAIGVCRYHPPK